MVTCCGLDEVYSSIVTQEASPIQDIYIGEWISRERGRLGAQGVGRCEVDFEWGRVEKDQGYMDMRRRISVRERSRNNIFLAPSFWEREKVVIGCVVWFVRGSMLN